ncbi:MAG: hypothetical protein IPP93_12610 [Chitinophagaceae bacterium]|nr:hypothetical protein [Chitinophagaceae bacterium]MBL0336781.1 hypothetical protein [Chitinophagaceae bacterium]
MQEEIKKEKKLKEPWFDWKKWLNYQSIVKQVPFLLFLTVLAVLYIFNGHYADNTIRAINKTAKEVQELKYEYISLKGELMLHSKPSELVKAVEVTGLKEPDRSPVVLADSTTINN